MMNFYEYLHAPRRAHATGLVALSGSSCETACDDRGLARHPHSFSPFSCACRVSGNIYCLYNASHVALHTYRQLASRQGVAVQGTAAFRGGIRRQGRRGKSGPIFDHELL